MATVVRVGVLGVVVVLVGLAALWGLQRRLIYFPDPAAPPPVKGAEDVVLATDDGLRLDAWLIQPTEKNLRVVVVTLPGNGGNRIGRMPLAEALRGRGLTVLLVDYRGYGGNPGSPSEAGLLSDARAGLDYVRQHFPGYAIIYFGESLGTGVATALAMEHQPDALVLRSPFTSLADVGQEHYPFLPVRLLLRDHFPVRDLIGKVNAPTLVIYGTADQVVPAKQSQAVAEQAHAQTVVIPGADHNDDALLDGDELVDAVTALAQRVRP